MGCDLDNNGNFQNVTRGGHQELKGEERGTEQMRERESDEGGAEEMR